MSKILLLSVMFNVFLIGYLLSRDIEIDNTNEIEKLEAEIEKMKSINKNNNKILKDFKKFREEDFANYLSIEEVKEHYIRSDDIIEKMLLLFLMALDLKLEDHEKKWASKKSYRQENLKKVLTKKDDVNIKDDIKIDSINTEFEINKSKVLTEGKVAEYEILMLGTYKNKRPYIETLSGNILNDLWKFNKEFSGELKSVRKNLLQYYLDDYQGVFIDLKGEINKIEAKISFDKFSKKKNPLLVFELLSGNKIKPIYVAKTLKALHPKSHSNSSHGACRGFILSSENLSIYLIKDSKRNKIIGKIFAGIKKNREFLGVFSLNRKKK